MSTITPADGFLATDGTFFLTENEALAHQHGLDLTEEIKAFVGADRFSITAFSEVSVIIGWEKHKKLKQLKG